MMTTSPSPSDAPSPDAPKPRSRVRRIITSSAVVLGVLTCVFLTAIGVSAMGGYVAGQKQRNVEATQTTVMNIDVQYKLGVSDLDAGNYERAAQRLRWVLDHAPQYPGAADALAKAEQSQQSANGTAIPTLIPSTSNKPDDLYAEAQTFYQQQDWANAISRLERIQGIDPTYHTIDIKEMLYKAYSTLGVVYIRDDRMEEGLYLLGQAEKIHPLDDQTGGERNLARLYLKGKTYWGLDWNIVIQNFVAIYQIAPNYRDVGDRLRTAYIKLGDQLTLAGTPCDGVTQYDNALNIKQDSDIQQKRDAAQNACDNPTAIPSGTPQSGTPGGSETPSLPTGAPTSDLNP